MNSYGETAGDIGLKVKAKKVENGFAVVTMGHITSTMAPLLTHEIERIAHTMRVTRFTDTEQVSSGFPYELPAVLGED